jgi:hypothetical protein
MATCSSFSVAIHGEYLVFMTATAENPVLYKYVVIEGVKTFIALSVNHFSQAAKTEEVYLHQHVSQETITGYAYELLLFRSH